MVKTANGGASRAQSQTERIRALYLLNRPESQVAGRSRWYGLSKRACDIFAAAWFLLVASPGMIAVALAVKLTSSGPAILVQERVGQGGRVFAFYKFRSMYNNGDRSEDERFAREYINGSQGAAATVGGVFKPANDGRVTPVGRFLRKTSLDELPQLVNVLKGDMSLVGPRPSMPYEVDAYKPWHFRRLDVLPGITGLAQVMGRSSLTFKDIVKIDIEYIGRRSLLLDLAILLRTLPVVLSQRGAR